MTGAAVAQNLSNVNFDNYNNGDLAGQGAPAWNVQSSSPADYQVQSAFSQAGKAVLIDTGPMISVGWGWQDLAPTQGNILVVSQVSAYIETDPLDRPSSAVGLDAYQDVPFTRMAAIRMRTTEGGTLGGVVMIAGTSAFDSGLPAPALDTWHRLTLVLNLSNGTAAGFFNGTPVFTNAPLAMPSWAIGTSTYTDSDLYTVPFGFNRCYYDNYRVDGVAIGNLRGVVELQDWEASTNGIPVVVEIRDSTGSTVLETRNTTLDANGEFNVGTTTRGDVTVAVKAPKWLNAFNNNMTFGVNSINLTDFGYVGLTWSLMNGDADDDNEVGIGDFAVISAAFGTALGDPGYDARADLNGDDEVNIADYAIMSINFGEVGV